MKGDEKKRRTEDRAMEFSMEPERLEIQVPATLAWIALQRWSGPYPSAVETTDRILMCEGIEPRNRIRLLNTRSILHWRMGRPGEATADAVESLALARDLGDQGLVGASLTGLADALREPALDRHAVAREQREVARRRAVGALRER